MTDGGLVAVGEMKSLTSLRDRIHPALISIHRSKIKARERVLRGTSKITIQTSMAG